MLAVLTVNANLDNTTADASFTMREAVAVVNAGTTSGVIPDLGRALTAGETAQVNATVPLGTNDAIKFTSSGEIVLDRIIGQIEISKSVTIDAGALASGVTVNADDPSPGLHTGEGIRISTLPILREVSRPCSSN